jgi:predicted transcriptional regulator
VIKKKETQVLLEPRMKAARKEIDETHRRMKKLAVQLHEVYKKYKAGIIKEEDLTEKQKELLRRYYGLK